MRVALASSSLALALLMACGSTANPPAAQGDDAGAGGDGQAMPDGGTSDDGGGFVTAPHPPFPTLAPHAKKILANPHVVSITYTNDPNRQSLEDFGTFIVGSNWMSLTGKDYGIGAATHTAVRLTTASPATVMDAEISTLIDQKITDGTLPALPATGSQLIYMIYYPKGTSIDDGTGSILCTASGGVGYHSTATHNGIDFAYAVVPDCSGKLGDITSTASHEIIEAASDPYLAPNEGYFMDVAPPSLWWAANPDENADLCQYEADVMEGPWEIQRIWSTTAAAAGGAPCVPVPQGEVYYRTSASPDTIQKVPAGGTATFTMTGWSTAPIAPWKIIVDVADNTDFDPAAVLSASTIQNGGTATVTLTAPAGMAVGKIGAAYISSGPYYRYWPVAIQVQ